MKKKVLIIVFFALYLFSFAGDIHYNTKIKEYSLESPAHTVWTHLTYLQQDQFHNPEIAAKTLNTSSKNTAHNTKLSIYLKEILDYNNLYITQEKLSDNPAHFDSVLSRHVFAPFSTFPDIYLERINGKWLYSAHTVSKISELHEAVEQSLGSRIMRSIPDFGHKKLFLNVQLWQLTALLFVILLSMIFQKLFTAIVAKIINQYIIRFGKDKNAKELIQPVAKPISLVIIAFFLMQIVPSFKIPIKINFYLILGIRVFASISTILVFYRIVDVLIHYMKRFADKTESTLDDQLVPIVEKSLKIFVIISGTLLLLQNFDVDVTALLAGLSIGGLAFALAAQDTIKNLFGSVMIFVDRPFQIGDWIIGDGFEGVVEEVGFRSTRIRTFANSLVSIPNGKLSDVTINNMGKRSYRRYTTTLGVDYNTPPELLDAFVEGLRELVKIQPKTRKDYFEIHFHSYGDFSLNVLVYLFFETEDWSKELEARHQFNMEIMRLAKSLGVSFAFPTQTLKVDTLPGRESLETNYNPIAMQAKANLKEHLDIVKKKYNS